MLVFEQINYKGLNSLFNKAVQKRRNICSLNIVTILIWSVSHSFYSSVLINIICTVKISQSPLNHPLGLSEPTKLYNSKNYSSVRVVKKNFPVFHNCIDEDIVNQNCLFLHPNEKTFKFPHLKYAFYLHNHFHLTGFMGKNPLDCHFTRRDNGIIQVEDYLQ